MFNKIRPLIFKFSPEVAHSLAIKTLKLNALPKKKIKNKTVLETSIFNKIIENPIGVAAGFDKNAEVYNPLFNLGFGFVEVGTITPEPQYGNPKPRVFRLEEDEALINRLGFNNSGSEEIYKRTVIPFYILILSLISSSLLIKPKSNSELWIISVSFLIKSKNFLLDCSKVFCLSKNSLDKPTIFFASELISLSGLQ